MIGKSTGRKPFRPVSIVFGGMPHHLPNGQTGTPKGTASIFAARRTALIFGNRVLGSDKVTVNGKS